MPVHSKLPALMSHGAMRNSVHDVSGIYPMKGIITMTNTKQRILSCALVVLMIVGFALIYQNQMNFPVESSPALQPQTPGEPISGTAFKLNTVVVVTIYDSTDQSLIDDALALCDKYEAIFSRTMESSELYHLNHGTLPQDSDGYIVSPEMADLVSKAVKYAELSEGRFDPAIEPLSSLWDFASEEKVIPAEEVLQAALPLVNYKDITVAGNHIQFAKSGMGLDLGAIAKGYIADRMKEFLISKGVKSATINLGGNLLCIGSKPDGSSFRIGIQKPFANRSETITIVNITDQSVVSSGIYERFFEKDGQFYHHILNPETGYPYDNSLIAVTIISDNSVDGDGLSTSCFALGLEKGMELINSMPDVHAVFITNDYELHYSKDFPKQS